MNKINSADVKKSRNFFTLDQHSNIILIMILETEINKVKNLEDKSCKFSTQNSQENSTKSKFKFMKK